MLCDKCSAPLQLKSGSWGRFWGCPNYKKCGHKPIKYTGQIVQSTPQDTTFKGYTLFDVDCTYAHIEGGECPSCHGKYSPSEWQKAIIQYVKSWRYGYKNALAIGACAGSGKTTLLSELTRYLDKSIRIGVLSFAKKNANDFIGKFREGIYTGTHHALLRGDYMRQNKRGKLDTNKKRDIFYALINGWDKDTKKQVLKHMGNILKVVSGINMELLPMSSESINEVCERYKISFNGDEEKCHFLIKSVHEENERLSRLLIVDFDDLLIWAHENPSSLTQFDYLFVDEYQDTNTLQRKVYSFHARYSVIIVGDKNQGIYVWRGASINAMEEGIKMFGAHVLTLPTSYRCPKIHARYINENLPERYYMDVPAWAKEGELIEDMSLEDFYTAVKPGSLILCRYNAPLVKPCLNLIASGINAKILGRDFSEQLINLIQKVSPDMGLFWGELADYIYAEQIRLRNARKETQADILEDKYNVILALGENVKSTYDLISKVESIFSDDNGQVTFSSIHKAKGAEAESVYLFDRHAVISPKATTEDEITQEENALYVALSRSKNYLAFVTLPKK